MKSQFKIFLSILCVIMLVVVLDALFIVTQTQQAIVLQFGEPKKVIKEPGLKIKIPFVQNVLIYDNRLLGLDPPAKEVLLSDKKRIVVDAFLRFRIVNPLLFYQALQTEQMAQSRLSDATVSSLRDVLGKYDMKTILSPARTEIMEKIREDVDSKAALFGVEVVDVRIRRADLPAETSQAVYARMRSEREREAKEFRAQGEQMNQEIKAQADRDRIRILAQANKEAQILRGQGDKEAANIWAKASKKNKDFYAFYRSLEAYKKAMKSEKTSLVLSPDSEFFRFLSEVPVSLKR